MGHATKQAAHILFHVAAQWPLKHRFCTVFSQPLVFGNYYREKAFKSLNKGLVFHNKYKQKHKNRSDKGI